MTGTARPSPWLAAVAGAALAFGAGCAPRTCASGAASAAQEPRAARLCVVAPEGASLTLDDVAIGEAPLPAAVEVEPGAHALVVTQGGHRGQHVALMLPSGSLTLTKLALEPTPQRRAAWALLGLGAGGVAGGATLGVLAVVAQRGAQAVLDRASAEDLTAQDQADYAALSSQEEDRRLGSAIAGGVGLGVAVVGGFLFAFDDGTLPPIIVSARAARGPGLTFAVPF